MLRRGTATSPVRRERVGTGGSIRVDGSTSEGLWERSVRRHLEWNVSCGTLTSRTRGAAVSAHLLLLWGPGVGMGRRMTGVSSFLVNSVLAWKEPGGRGRPSPLAGFSLGAQEQHNHALKDGRVSPVSAPQGAKRGLAVAHDK